MVDESKAPFDYSATDLTDLETDVAAIKAKTDNLPTDPADQSDVEAAITTAHSTTDGKVDAVQSDVTAVKAKTDNLPADPASESSVESAITSAHSTTDGKVDAIQSDVTAIKANTDLIPATDGGALTHDVTVAHGTDEQQIYEIAGTNVYALSTYVDLATLVTAAEGTIVTIRLYNKVDGTNYALIAETEFTIASGTVMPNIEANMLFGYSSLTIQLSSAVTETRTINYRKITRSIS